MALYNVETKFGKLLVDRDSIADARKWAKEAHGVGPRCVTKHQEYVRCDDCSAAPCCCKKP